MEFFGLVVWWFRGLLLWWLSGWDLRFKGFRIEYLLQNIKMVSMGFNCLVVW